MSGGIVVGTCVALGAGHEWAMNIDIVSSTMAEVAGLVIIKMIVKVQDLYAMFSLFIFHT
jgi:hypothetical protein